MSTQHLKGASPGRSFLIPLQGNPCSGTSRIHRESSHHE